MGFIQLARDSIKLKNISTIIGLAFLLPYFRLGSYVNAWLSTSHGIADIGPLHLLDALYTTTAAIVFVGGAAIAQIKGASLVCGSRLRTLLLATGLLGIAGLAILVCLDPQTNHLPLFVVAIVASSAYLAIYTMAYGWRSAQGEPGQAAVNILFAFILHLIVQVVSSGIGADASLLAPVVPPLMTIVAFDPRSFSAPEPTPANRQPPYALPWVMIGASVVLMYGSAFLVNILTGKNEIDPTGFSNTLSKSLVVLVFALVLLVLFSDGAYTSSKIVVAFGITLVFYSAVLLFVYLAPAYQNVASSLKYCLRLFLWLLLACNTNKRGAASVSAFALYGIVTVVLIHPLTFGFSYEMGIVYQFAQTPGAAPLMAVLLFALFAGAVTALVRSHLKSTESIQATTLSPANNEDSLEQAVHLAIDPYNLTQRETEVVILTYRGRNARRIAENLSVSEATVRGHLMHAYRKLDIHSKQELIDLIDKSY